MTRILHVKNTPANHPLPELRAAMAKYNAMGHSIFQTWSCSDCGKRVISTEANTIYDRPTCPECNAVTDVTRHGCNYRVALKGPKTVQEFEEDVRAVHKKED